MREEREDADEKKGVELTRALIMEETREEPEKVTSLEFHNRQVKGISVLEECTSLRKLDLSFNLVTSLVSMRYLKNLKVLRLYNNNLDSLHGVHHLVNLQILSVDSNKLTRFEGLENLKFLHELSAAFNNLQDISPGSLPTCLRILDLSSNGIEKLQGLSGLGKLEQLSLNNNKLRDLKGLPVSPCQLKEFQASGNEIKSIKGIEKYARDLDIVRVEDNCISSLSNLSKRFEEATELYLSGNKFEDLVGIENFPVVEILDLSKNRLCDIDALKALSPLEELRDLKVEGNPFAMGGQDAHRAQALDMFPCLECLDDRDVKASSAPRPAPPSSAAGQEGKIMPRAPPGARPPAPRRRSMGASRPSSAQNPAASSTPGARPMSARAGGGNRLLTAVQYEAESLAFEEQVFGYQQKMTKLLKEMKQNLELPMDEVASMAKASEGEVLTASLPEPPVIGVVKQEHKVATFRETPVEEAKPGPGEKRPSRGDAGPDDGARLRGGAGMGKEERDESSPGGRSLLSEDDGEECVARYSNGRGGEFEDDDDDEGPGVPEPKVDQYEFLATSNEDANARANESPTEKAKQANYKGFKVPRTRPLSARKNSNREAGLPKNKPIGAKGGGAGLSSSANVGVPKVSRLKRNTFKFKAATS
ncbi:L domain-containing protein [Chloropicon primus]|uniref:L domain-containing protein n=2 Tax=Chloropicon primus TaxID=1764295 RepID=A0A5B8MIK7_9CHLO|nr:L domain-containing protein [Chloropicon primus]UPQ98409.1 L domain-containing protein [Chloropicon primus]|eukprot:QDZ19200.1 L domain-containing protein [Chloropicon primus]